MKIIKTMKNYENNVTKIIVDEMGSFGQTDRECLLCHALYCTWDMYLCPWCREDNIQVEWQPQNKQF